MTVVLKVTDAETDSAMPGTQVSDRLRRCLVSGELKPRAEMIRFVIGPDKAVFPDLAEKLPGHGLWLTATREAIRTASRKNLFARAAKEPAQPAADLADSVISLLRKRCCDILGLAKGAGIAILGESQTQAALRGGKLALFLRAPDATQTLDNRFDVEECDLLTRDEMGAALGYDTIVYAGLLPHGLTGKLKSEIVRLRSMTQIHSAESPAMDTHNRGQGKSE